MGAAVIGEVRAGRDPRRPVVRPGATLSLDNLSAFLDAYLERCVKSAGLRSVTTVRSRVTVLKAHLGKLPLDGLDRIDLRRHDLRHEGACRLLADGVDIRIIQLMLGHASIQQMQRYSNVTNEELRRGLDVSWGRPLRAVSGG